MDKMDNTTTNLQGREIADINQIDTSTKEGQYLMAAMALITTTIRTDKTPNEVLNELTVLKNTMYPGIIAEGLIDHGV